MRQKVFFILALISGLIAAGSVYYYLSGVNQVSSKVTKSIVITKNKIDARSVIKAEDLELKQIPAEGYPLEGLSIIQNVAGGVALVNLEPGQLVLKSAIQVPENGTTVKSDSIIVPEGKRAVAIPVGLVSGVGYTVKPGDYVDLLVTFDVKENNESKSYTTLVAQDVLVLNTQAGAGAEAGAEENSNAKAFILALSVPQAMSVTHATEKGSIRLLLRNPADKGLRTDPPFDTNTFIRPDYFLKFK